MTSIVYDFPAIASAMKPEDWWPKKDEEYGELLTKQSYIADGNKINIGKTIRIRLPNDFRVTDTCSLVTAQTASLDREQRGRTCLKCNKEITRLSGPMINVCDECMAKPAPPPLHVMRNGLLVPNAEGAEE